MHKPRKERQQVLDAKHELTCQLWKINREKARETKRFIESNGWDVEEAGQEAFDYVLKKEDKINRSDTQMFCRKPYIDTDRVSGRKERLMEREDRNWFRSRFRKS